VKRRTSISRSALGARAIDLVLVAIAVAYPAFSVLSQVPELETSAPARSAGPPASLRDTGLYVDWNKKTVAPGNLPYAPQYPLWTDGAAKRRWIRIPAGTAIDASAADAWQFPVGTWLWKEFSFGGRRVETRTMERTARGWVYATYAWNQDQTDAVLAPARGAVSSAEVAPGVAHAIPGQPDCRACHEGTSPVLGFSALQLSPDRDPAAIHAEVPAPGSVDLAALVELGLLRGLPGQLLARAPRIAASSATERAALGYLHGNCGGCHGPQSSLASLDMSLAYPVDPGDEGRAPAIETTFGRASRFALPGAQAGASVRVAPGQPDRSVLLARMRSHGRFARMPPLGTQVVDERAADLIEQWISSAPESPDAATENKEMEP
jgi:hypothetical protein